jgi:putative phosphoribosyl transferase
MRIQFTDRYQAGRMLARTLEFSNHSRGLVLGVPRGGVPIGYEIAKQLEWPLEIVLCKKIGHPANKEYAIGAAGISDFVVHYEAGITPDYVEAELQAVQLNLNDMLTSYMGSRELSDVKGRTLIVCDDGIATGKTLLMTLKILRRQQPERIILAAPVASEDAYQYLKGQADRMLVLHHTPYFAGVGEFYESFTATSDGEVRRLLELNMLEVPR